MANFKDRNDESQMDYNQQIAESQKNKTSFRAHKTATSADPFGVSRLENAIAAKQIENG